MTGHSLEELSCRLTLDQFTRDSDHGAAAVSDAGAVAQPAGGRQGRPGTRGGEARHGGRGVQRQTKTQSGEQNEYSLISCYTTQINLGNWPLALTFQRKIEIPIIRATKARVFSAANF